MVYLDLDELPALFDGTWLWSARRPALAWFRRADYLGDPDVPLARRRPRAGRASAPASSADGPIRLLTHLRYFGQCFNPVSFYYCFDAAGERVVAVVAEVTNTPWGERHAYVLAVDRRADHGTVRLMRARFAQAAARLAADGHGPHLRLAPDRARRAAARAHRVRAATRRRRACSTRRCRCTAAS